MNLSSVVRSVEADSDVSDWDLSEDELVGADDDGAVDDPLRGSVLSPLDKLDASVDDTTPDMLDLDSIVSQGPVVNTDREDRLQLEDSSEDLQPVLTSSPRPAQQSQTADPFSHPPFSIRTGSQLPLTEVDEPHEFFEAIFGSDTFDHIAQQTNLYAAQAGASWDPTCGSEMKLFIGIILAMGVHRLPHLHDYWSKHPLLGVPGITHSMPRDRFKELLRYFHINDNTQAKPRDHPEYDKLHKIRPLLNKIRSNTQRAYIPHKQLSIDEAMVLFKGRSSIKQFMPLKPIKRGYKIWCLCVSINGLAYDIEVYLGATGSGTEGSLGEKVVMRLIEKVTGQGYEVYMDNFFTSPALSLALREHQIFVIGTARVNRKGFPQSLRDTKAFAKTATRGEHRSVLIHEGKTECLVWKDNKPVPLINSISPPANTATVKRTAKDGSRNAVPCPESIKLYNMYMGGVDLFDFKRKTYSCSRKSRKWWFRLFYFLVDMATTNSYIRKNTSYPSPSI